MYTIASYSMVLNDSQAYSKLIMDSTANVAPNLPLKYSVAAIVKVAKERATGGIIKNLIINGHGRPGSVEIGSTLDINTMQPFSKIKGLVKQIWFPSCFVARIIDKNTKKHGDWSTLQKLGFTSGDGHAFISKFAKLTGCTVIAPTELQTAVKRGYAHKMLHAFEGLLLTYDKEGKIIYRNRSKSAYGFNHKTGSARTPNNE